jgi:hypothetical protein
MSAYMTLLTPMTDQECLLAALSELGFGADRVVCSAQPVPLRGWQRGQTAHVVLPKEHTGDRYNDIGFLRGPTGFTAILSDDHPRLGTAWLAQLHSRYTAHASAKQERLAAEERRRLDEERQQLVEAQRQAVHARAKAMGYQVQETREGAKIRLVLVKRSY